jgi:hypothetical protein
MKLFEVIYAGVIGMIVLVLILVWFKTGVELSYRDVADSVICKESVRLNAGLRYDKATSKIDVNCPTRFIQLPVDKQTVVFESLALAMADTWNEFFEGRVEVFETDDQNYCVVRRVIEFKEPMQYKGFLDYLLQHNNPYERKSYFTYLSNIDVEQGSRTLTENSALKNADMVDTAQPYAAIFLQAKKEEIGKIMGAKIGAWTGGVAGVVGAGTLIYFTGGLGTVVSTQVVAGATGVGTFVGGTAGFLLGSDYPANWESAMLLVPYNATQIKRLNCTLLPAAVAESN